jgi:hypothetical protein
LATTAAVSSCAAICFSQLISAPDLARPSV